jgi:hypothetical protein
LGKIVLWIKGTFVKDKIRSLKFLVLGASLTFVDICREYFRGNINVLGAIVGTCFGLILALTFLKRSFSRAKKDIFVETMSKHGRNIMLGTVFVLPFIFVIMVKYYFPGINLSIAFNATSLVFFLFVYTATGALGIYFLECRYGQKYYFGKQK